MKSTISAAVFVSLLLAGTCHGASLRRMRMRKTNEEPVEEPKSLAEHIADKVGSSIDDVLQGGPEGEKKKQDAKPSGDTKMVGEAKLEVLKNTSITKKETDECLCPLGQFWHWRIKQCINQGPWGYECGFFPGEHHRFVCKDNLKCELLKGTKVKYQHDGAVPASCKICEAQDKCMTGEARHDEECLKETTLGGEASCTVRVTLKAGVTASVTKEHTVDEHSASATHEATAEAEGVGEGSATVTIAQVKKAMKLKAEQKVGPVLGAQVISKGDKMAFDMCYEAALKEAMAKASKEARSAAKMLAEEKAAADAKLAAEAKAAEDAAWDAEAGRKAAEDAAAQAQADADKAAAAAEKAAQEAADKAKAAEEAGKAEAEAAKAKAEAAAETEALTPEQQKEFDDKQKVLEDVISGNPTAATGDATIEPAGSTKPEGPPRKVTEEQYKAKLP